MALKAGWTKRTITHRTQNHRPWRWRGQSNRICRTPGRSILCQSIPVTRNTKPLDVICNAVLPSETRALWWSTFLQPAKTKLLRNAVIRHPGDMPKPLQPPPTNHVRHQLSISPQSSELNVVKVIQLLTKTRHTQDTSQTLMVKRIQPGLVTLQQRPALRAVQQQRQNASGLQHSLNAQRQFGVLEYTLQRTKCPSGVCKSTIDLTSDSRVG